MRDEGLLRDHARGSDHREAAVVELGVLVRARVRVRVRVGVQVRARVSSPSGSSAA